MKERKGQFLTRDMVNEGGATTSANPYASKTDAEIKKELGL